jgi:hypothetical protein
MCQLGLRVFALSMLITVLTIPVPSVVSADEPSLADCREGPTDGEIICRDSRSGTIVIVNVRATKAPQPGPNTSSSGSTKRYVPYNRLTTGADGQPCATTGYVEEGVTPPDERLIVDPNPRESNIPVTGNDLALLEQYPPCPPSPTAPGQPLPLETRSMLAARYWEQLGLPQPLPRIAPGRAITGKMAYLETKGELAHTYTSDTVFGPLQIVASGSYIINWGDGTTTGPHSFEGGPWPNGRITHEYLNVGSYNVIVTEKWTATWSLDGERGVLRTLQTVGRISNFPVEQIQAVIGR